MKNKTLPVLLASGLLFTALDGFAIAAPAFAAPALQQRVAASTPAPLATDTAEPHAAPTNTNGPTALPPLPKPLPSSDNIKPATPAPATAPGVTVPSSGTASQAPVPVGSNPAASATSQPQASSGTVSSTIPVPSPLPSTGQGTPAASATPAPTVSASTAPTTVSDKGANPALLIVGIVALLGVVAGGILLLVRRRRG